jgi:hypothetical protein
LVKGRGLTASVKDTTATSYSSLDEIVPQDPRNAEVVADASSGYRDSRLWLEKTAIYAILTGISTLDAQIRDIDDVAAGDELDALRGRPSPS